VLILAGGLSHERDVSLRSGRRVAGALRQAGCEVTESDLVAGVISGLRHHPVDLVWPLLHGASGEDGSVREVLDLLDQPYLGSNARASRVAWNKAIAKTTLARAGLATPEYLTLPQALFRELGADQLLALVDDRFGLPVVVKPLQGGSALGISRVDQADCLPRAMMDCFAYGDYALIERAVDGVELAVSVVDLGDGPITLPAVEISTDGPYDYDARYNPGRTEFFTPARITARQTELASHVAIQAHLQLGLERISRTDMILSDDGVAYFLEVNVAPGMQETSLLPQAALAAGHELPALYRNLVQASINNHGQ
jgi:D-alanine-D-alanine ligase